MNDTIDIFADVNTLIDAVVFQSADDQPVEFTAEEFRYTDSPAGVVMMLIGNGDLVNGKRLVLHTSNGTLRLMASVLSSEYRWNEPAIHVAARAILKLVRISDGIKCGDNEADGIRTYEGVDDREDQHRLAEARRCEAQIFLTRDRGVHGKDPTTLPAVLSPRDFLKRVGVDF